MQSEREFSRDMLVESLRFEKNSALVSSVQLFSCQSGHCDVRPERKRQTEKSYSSANDKKNKKIWRHVCRDDNATPSNQGIETYVQNLSWLICVSWGILLFFGLVWGCAWDVTWVQCSVERGECFRLASPASQLDECTGLLLYHSLPPTFWKQRKFRCCRANTLF